jgi:hypothetical protein
MRRGVCIPGAKQGGGDRFCGWPRMQRDKKRVCTPGGPAQRCAGEVRLAGSRYVGEPEAAGGGVHRRVQSRDFEMQQSRELSFTLGAHPTAPVLGSSRQFWAWIGHLQPSVDVDLRSKASLPLAASEGVRQTLGLRL